MNVLIIGLGKLGLLRFHLLKKNKNVNNIFLFDYNINNIKIQKNKKVQIIRKLNNISNLNISCAFVCVPTFVATKYVSFLIKNQINVFCEKPPATKYEDLVKIKKVLNKNKRINLTYGFNHRYHESVHFIKKVIDSNKLGKILWIRGRYGKPIDSNYLNGWRGNFNKSGGGILIDQGIHMIDLFLHFIGKFNVIKSILSNNYIKKNLEDNAFIIFKNSRNQTASLHSTLTLWRHLFSIEIFFTKGYLILNGLKTPSRKYGRSIIKYSKNLKKPPLILWGKKIIKKFNNDKSFINETENFIGNIKNKKTNRKSIDEAIAIMKIIKEVYSQNKNIFKK
jgi:1,5-anhydro-D-fructose reductase (1,5-anhydro-D-mannitol-forming)